MHCRNPCGQKQYGNSGVARSQNENLRFTNSAPTEAFLLLHCRAEICVCFPAGTSGSVFYVSHLCVDFKQSKMACVRHCSPPLLCVSYECDCNCLRHKFPTKSCSVVSCMYEVSRHKHYAGFAPRTDKRIILFHVYCRSHSAIPLWKVISEKSLSCVYYLGTRSKCRGYINQTQFICLYAAESVR